MAVEITSGDILTPEQLSKHIKIFAGPGAGKTHFLVENIKNIASAHPYIEKSRTRKILCITYTNAAVDEIKRRLDRFSDSVEISTIHGFILEHIIKPFQEELKRIMNNDFEIQINGKAKITSQIEGLGILHGIDKEDIYRFVGERESVDEPLTYSKNKMSNVQVDVDTYLSDGKSEISQPKGVEKSHLKPIKEFTWSIVRKLTHDEILYFGYRILQENSTALYALRVKFPFVFVDEFQDTNPLQTKLIQLLGEKSTIVGVIGDVAQSIYSFQGARPSQFLEFSVPGERELIEYSIAGNRRSTLNIVNFNNFIRYEDESIFQTSVREYKDDNEKVDCESKSITFLFGESTDIMKQIGSIISGGGVVLTRAWAAAFQYIQGIEDAQLKVLRAIYNSYYNSPIDIRAEIAEHTTVTWVRAFKFVFLLWEAFKSNSLIDVIRAFSLYVKIDKRSITPRRLILIKNMLNTLFADVSKDSRTIEVIAKLNQLMLDNGNAEFIENILETGFSINCFTEFDDEKFRGNISALTWDTSYKLFTEVFSKDSRYMTVHQAKGLEWDKVVVSVTPNKRFDKTTLDDMFSEPKVLEESPESEFARMYYVACSRAKTELFIHIADPAMKSTIASALAKYNLTSGISISAYGL